MAIKKRIMIVDDDVEFVEELKEMLESSGYEIAAYHDGPSALKEAPAFKPDVILLDLKMEGKSGFEVAEVSRSVAEVGRLPMLELKGLMTIAPLVNDAEEARPVFRWLRELRDALGLEHLSMGMTEDFEVAIEEGATMVRIGRAIFGEHRA